MKKYLNLNILYYLLIILTILIAIFLRLNTLLPIRPLWHDECSLALSLLDRNMFDFFRPLEHFQCAPYLFMAFSKFLTYIFGLKEYTLRIIPFCCGIFALPAFYLLSKDFLKNRWIILIVNFLFAINYQLIYYSQEFKQYSSDVLIAILTLYCLSKIDLKIIKHKQNIILGLIMAILPLLSFPSVFIIASYILIQIIKHKKSVIKELFIITIPLIIVSGIYYFNVAAASHASQIQVGSYFWEMGFIKPNPISWLHIFKMNFGYFFFPNKMQLFALILFGIGVFYTIKQKTALSKMFISTIIFAILASFLKVYPLIQRTGLYLVPILLLIVSCPIDKINWNRKVYSLIITICFIFYFSGYTKHYLMNFKNSNFFNHENAKVPMQIIKENYAPDEIVAFNIASDSEYFFYTGYFAFTPVSYVTINPIYNNKDSYFKILNQLPPNRIYWFYYPFEYVKTPVVNYLKEWSQDKNILFEKQFKNSYLLKIKL